MIIIITIISGESRRFEALEYMRMEGLNWNGDGIIKRAMLLLYERWGWG